MYWENEHKRWDLLDILTRPTKSLCHLRQIQHLQHMEARGKHPLLVALARLCCRRGWPQNKRCVKQRGIIGTQEQCAGICRGEPLYLGTSPCSVRICACEAGSGLSWELTSCCSVPRLFHHPCHTPTLLGEQPGWWESKTYKQRLSLEREKFQLSLQMEQHLLLSVTVTSGQFEQWSLQTTKQLVGWKKLPDYLMEEMHSLKRNPFLPNKSTPPEEEMARAVLNHSSTFWLTPIAAEGPPQS